MQDRLRVAEHIAHNALAGSRNFGRFGLLGGLAKVRHIPAMRILPSAPAKVGTKSLALHMISRSMSAPTHTIPRADQRRVIESMSNIGVSSPVSHRWSSMSRRYFRSRTLTQNAEAA